MRIGLFVSLLAVWIAASCAATVASYAANNPIKGVGVVIKHCKCPPNWQCCSSAAERLAAGFFGPGSASFEGVFGLEGACAHACGGCGDVCPDQPDSRIDFASDGVAGPFDAVLPAMTLHSVEPLPVDLNGTITFFDVIVTLSGPGPAPDDPIPGRIELPGAEPLPVGATSHVASGALDLHASFTFVDVVTRVPVGSTLEQDLHLTLRETGLPVTRFADGTPEGYIVLGSDGTGVLPFTFDSPAGEIVLQLSSVETGGPTSARPATWGTLKSIYR